MKSVKVNITETEKVLLDNMIKILSRAKIDLEGVEILAAADSMRWLSRLQKAIELEMNKPPMEVLEKPVSKKRKTKETPKE